MPALEEELQANAELRDRLAGQSDEIRHRIFVKDAIVVDLLAHRITLAEATERFAAMIASHPETMGAIAMPSPATRIRKRSPTT